MWIVRLALRRPYTFVVAALLLLLLTPFILLRTPTDIFPAINIPVVSIVWNYTGLNAVDMENRIVYNEERARVEVYIESLREQRVSIRKLGMEIHFSEGERIHTENSYKYDLEGLSQMATETGYERARTWMDEREQFSSNLFVCQ